MHWTQFILPVASTITVIVIAVVDVITHRRSSAQFDRIISEEMKLKDEQIKTIESKHDGILAGKDEQIEILKYFSSPHFRKAYDSMQEMHEIRIEQLNDEVNELNKKVESLTEKLIVENYRRTQLEAEITGMRLSQKARGVINAYTEGSRVAIENIEESVGALSDVGESIQRKAEEIINAAVIEITPTPTESVTVSDIARVELTGPEDETPAGVEET